MAEVVNTAVAILVTAFLGTVFVATAMSGGVPTDGEFGPQATAVPDQGDLPQMSGPIRPSPPGPRTMDLDPPIDRPTLEPRRGDGGGRAPRPEEDDDAREEARERHAGHDRDKAERDDGHDREKAERDDGHDREKAERHKEQKRGQDRAEAGDRDDDDDGGRGDNKDDRDDKDDDHDEEDDDRDDKDDD